MDSVTVETIIQGFSCCAKSYSDCNSCPYNSLMFDECQAKLRDDVMEALLKAKEAPTVVEQPKLPFMEDV